MCRGWDCENGTGRACHIVRCLSPRRHQYSAELARGSVRTNSSICTLACRTYLSHSKRYMLMLMMDANFRLCNLRRSSAPDPGLHTGLAYLVADKPYEAHYSKYKKQTDVSLQVLISSSGTDFLGRLATVADSRRWSWRRRRTRPV